MVLGAQGPGGRQPARGLADFSVGVAVRRGLDPCAAAAITQEHTLPHPGGWESATKACAGLARSGPGRRGCPGSLCHLRGSLAGRGVARALSSSFLSPHCPPLPLRPALPGTGVPCSLCIWRLVLNHLSSTLHPSPLCSQAKCPGVPQWLVSGPVRATSYPTVTSWGSAVPCTSSMRLGR